MNNKLRQIFTFAVAFVCILCVQISVSAIDLGDIGENLNIEGVLDLIDKLKNPETTTTAPETTTVDNAEDTSNPVSDSGTGVHTTTEPETTTVYQYPTNNYYPTQSDNGNANNSGYNNNSYTNSFFTTEPAGEESTTLSFEASLSDIFEDDSANIIVQTPGETFTIGQLVEKNENNNNNEFTWQMGALIAAAVLFVILLALIVALIIQNSKKKKKRRYEDSYPVRDESAAPVAVEIMTPERIAELLGNPAKRSVSDEYEMMSSDETAAAIKAAAIMGQFSGSYSDSLLRKYTDEPVMISPDRPSVHDIEYSTAADILKATDSMLEDIEKESGSAVNEAFVKPADGSLNINRICPDCGNDVPEDDIFCHNCGTYIG